MTADLQSIRRRLQRQCHSTSGRCCSPTTRRYWTTPLFLAIAILHVRALLTSIPTHQPLTTSSTTPVHHESGRLLSVATWKGWCPAYAHFCLESNLQTACTKQRKKPVCCNDYQCATLTRNTKMFREGCATPFQSDRIRYKKNEEMTKTSLSMGLGSFLKRHIIGDNYENFDDDNYESIYGDDMNDVDGEGRDRDDRERPCKNLSVKTSPPLSLPFLGRIIGGGKELDVDENDAKVSGNVKSRRNEDDPSTSTYRESVRERMDRIKRGGMTSEEKDAFLSNALGGKGGIKGRSSSRIKRSVQSKVPIRQSLPLGPSLEDGDLIENDKGSNYAEASSDEEKKESAETSWSSVVGRQRYGRGTSGRSSASMKMDDTAKQAWLNMVTSPTRFQSYQSVKGQGGGKERLADNSREKKSSSNDESQSLKSPSFSTRQQRQQMQNLAEAKRRLAEQQVLVEAMTVSGTGESCNSNKTAIESNPYLPKVRMIKSSRRERSVAKKFLVREKASPSDDGIENSVSEEGRKDLATRLEQAAILQEAQDAETRRLLEEQRLANEMVREKERRKVVERQKEREEEFRRQESLRLAKRQEEELRMSKIKEENRRVQEERRIQLEAAADSYWKNKLAKEQEYKRAMSSRGESDTSLGEEKRKSKEIINDSEEIEKFEGKFIEEGASIASKKERATTGSPVRQSYQKGSGDFKESQQEERPSLDAIIEKKKQQLSTSAVRPRIAADDDQLVDTVDLTSNVKSDIPSSKDIDMKSALRKREKSTNQDQISKRKPVRQMLPIIDDVAAAGFSKKLSNAESSRMLRGIEQRGQPDRNWKVSAEDKEKASKWGINVDKLL